MQNQTFKLSLKPNNYPPNVPFVYADQYDEGRVFAATIYDADGSLYNFNGETVTIVGTKPSGTGFSYTATASGNTVTFKTTGQMTVVAGNVTCGIILEKDGDRIGTLHFVLHVQPAALSADTIIDSDDFGSIISDAVAEYMEEHGIVIDPTLSVAGAAADAKATGDAIDELKSAFDLDSLTPGVKSALLACFDHVAWDDDDPTGQTYINALYDALYNRYWQVTNDLTNCTTSNESEQTIKGAAYTATITASAGYVMTGATVSITMGGTDVTASVYSNGVISIPAVTGALVITISAAAKQVSSISAVFTQGSNVVYTNDTLDSLKQYLVVTATYSDSTSETVPASGYTLSGALAEGTQTITVGFGGKTDTFTVDCTVKGWLYHFNESLASSSSEDFGLVGTGVYGAGHDSAKAYYHIIPTSGDATTDTQMGLKAVNLSRSPNLSGDFTISYWLATQVQGFQHAVWLTKPTGTSEDSITGSVSSIDYTAPWTGVINYSSKVYSGFGVQGTTSGLLVFRIANGTATKGQQVRLTIPSGFDTTAWHHYAWTKKGTTLRLFIDGGLIFTATLESANIYDAKQIAISAPFDETNTTDIKQVSNGIKMQDLYIAEFCKWESAFDASAITY